VVVAQLLAHGLQLSYGVLAPSVAWRYRVLITDTGTDIQYLLVNPSAAMRSIKITS
jgi:hypothetical protein